MLTIMCTITDRMVKEVPKKSLVVSLPNHERMAALQLIVFAVHSDFARYPSAAGNNHGRNGAVILTCIKAGVVNTSNLGTT